jgi:hypothetical protein
VVEPIAEHAVRLSPASRAAAEHFLDRTGDERGLPRLRLPGDVYDGFISISCAVILGLGIDGNAFGAFDRVRLSSAIATMNPASRSGRFLNRYETICTPSACRSFTRRLFAHFWQCLEQ